MAFLLWIHRRSEEPSVTSKECYWKKSSLSNVGTAKMDLASLVDKPLPQIEARNDQYVKDVVLLFPTAIGGIFDIEQQRNVTPLSIYQLFIKYREISGPILNADDFIQYMVGVMTDSSCIEAEKCTQNQSKNSLWYELKFGRVTASRIHEVCRCKTLSGSLAEGLMGASPALVTEPVIRGQKLESLVLEQIRSMRNIDIKKAGLFLKKNIPIFGASPDGITDTYCIEVKCPTKEKTTQLYVKDDVIQTKFLYQIQLQMYMSNRVKGLFCVASPNFEVNKEVYIYEVQLDRELCEEMIDQATEFWKNCVFKSLCNM